MKNISIVPYSDQYKAAFAQIWVPWLAAMTGKNPEAEDLVAVSDPEAFYIRAGGAVFFALDGEKPVGVVAVKKLAPGIYEFCKLVVLDSERGLGVGKRLVERCIEFAQDQHATLLMLQSFKRLEVALAMYRRMGFVEMPAPPSMLVLARTEVLMGMRIN
jgi:GNAT superfamily N-acetyltransferase